MQSVCTHTSLLVVSSASISASYIASASSSPVVSIGSDSQVHRARLNAKTSHIDSYNTDYSYTKYDNNFDERNDMRDFDPRSHSGNLSKSSRTNRNSINTNMNSIDTNINTTTVTAASTKRLPWHNTEVSYTILLHFIYLSYNRPHYPYHSKYSTISLFHFPTIPKFILMHNNNYYYNRSSVIAAAP